MNAAAQLELIPPGEILLREFLEPLGISQNQLARDIDVNPGRVAEIVHGKRAITADTALRLSKYFGMTAEFWMNLQSDYELRRARRETWPATQARIRSRADAA